MILFQEESVLDKLADAYNTATNKGQYQNLVSSIFNILDDKEKWVGDRNIKNINSKFETEKEKLLEAGE